ncbi:InlB B-repeat-containing protein [Paenibacillus shenyangensis]|uniref:InlB B-repeat-containing protein n=1 Tax=Paenibacillus sp. A9 TaxID=1284352 RepID=UPI00037CBD85|nr:InlB B-repeat-containing protein [Paenibacillus sp. A9]
MSKQKLGVLGKIWMVMVLLICSVGVLNQPALIRQVSAGGIEPYLGEIQLFPYPSAPRGWVSAAGQQLSISSNTALFSLLGNNFGGDGKTTFALPDLRAKAPGGMSYYIALQGIFPNRDGSAGGNGNAMLSEIRLFPYTFAPSGWLTANGQTLSITEYSALYSKLGTNFGGNGTTTFRLPTLADPQENVHYLISNDLSNYNQVTDTEYLGAIISFAQPVSVTRLVEASGASLPINQNQALFSLLGNRFGGNNVTTFNLPNLNANQTTLKYYTTINGIYPSLDPNLPMANNDQYNVRKNGVLIAAGTGVLFNDMNASTANLVVSPAHGTLDFHTDGSFQYMPAKSYTGTDVFTYEAVNGSGTSAANVTITVEETEPPVVGGVQDMEVYNTSVTPVFTNATALLNGQPYTSGTAVTAEGLYVLRVTNSFGAIFFQFTIDRTAPVVTGVTYGQLYSSSPVITFNEGTATLDGSAFASGSAVTEEGEHQLIVTDSAGNTSKVTFSVYFPRTVAFDSQGGTLVADQRVNYGTYAVQPSAPTRTGYSFGGWYIDQEGETPFDFGAVAIKADKTLYAKWILNAYTVNFDSSEGTSVDSQHVGYGKTVAKPADPTRTGYHFAGWYTDASRTIPFVFGSTVVTGDLTLYADWILNSYTVSFDTYGGSVVADLAVRHGSSVIRPADPVKNGYTFAGWYTDAARTVPFAFGNAVVTGDVTLYAAWTTNSYTVSFDTYNGSAVPDLSVDYGDKAVQPAAPSRTGYLFAGWYTDRSYNTPFDFNHTAITGNLTLYAKWVTEAYTVTFNTYGGTEVPPIFVEYEGTVTEPVQPTRDGYSFDGWYTDGTLSRQFEFGTTPVTRDLTLYAGWTIKPVPIDNKDDNNKRSRDTVSTIISNGGSLIIPIGRSGQLNTTGISLFIPANAASEELRISMSRLTDKDTQQMWTNGARPVSPVYELLKNVSRNFDLPVTLTLTFDPAELTGNQTPGIYYLNESTGSWVQVEGSRVDGNQITAQVNHFTKFAVLAAGGSPNSNVSDTPPAAEPEVDKNVASFSDIEGHWAAESIRQAVDAGIVKGYADGTFKPGQAVTRAEFTLMLLQAMGLPGNGTPLAFTDKEKIGAWAQPAIAEAVRQGWIHGNADGSFRPNDQITRAEMAVMAAAALHSNTLANPKTTFVDDKKIPVWAHGAVAAMQQAGILSGKSANTFDPAGQTTRAEAVKVIMMIQAMRNS